LKDTQGSKLLNISEIPENPPITNHPLQTNIYSFRTKPCHLLRLNPNRLKPIHIVSYQLLCDCLTFIIDKWLSLIWIMFDFEKLTVYRKAKQFNSEARRFLKKTILDSGTADRLRRGSFSIVMNIAEGSGRFSKPDRIYFYVISRSSVFECMAIYDVLSDEKYPDDHTYIIFYEKLISDKEFQDLSILTEELNGVLLAMINDLQQCHLMFSNLYLLHSSLTDFGFLYLC